MDSFIFHLPHLRQKGHFHPFTFTLQTNHFSLWPETFFEKFVWHFGRFSKNLLLHSGSPSHLARVDVSLFPFGALCCEIGGHAGFGMPGSASASARPRPRGAARSWSPEDRAPAPLLGSPHLPFHLATSARTRPSTHARSPPQSRRALADGLSPPCSRRTRPSAPRP